ncbi:hypothetical protein BS78_08G054800 [Paspalum vaginatum]|nr:hypothetical protein BS78_08G054800 [Paspalum vaginatum]
MTTFLFFTKHIGERRTRYGVRDPLPGKKKSNLGGATGYLAAENQDITRQLVRAQQPVGVKNMPDLEKWIREDAKRMNPSVMSIVGFGGVGKTTVAMALYKKYGPEFQRRAMVTVSQNTDPESVLRSILSQVKPLSNNGEQRGEDSTGAISENNNPVVGAILSCIRLPSPNQKQDNSSGRDNLDKITKELKNRLANTRYLLLIDDVWSSSTWQNIWKYFPEENMKGSRIIVTTRFQAVATTCSARKDHDHIHSVDVLSGDEANSLFIKTMSECRGTGDRQSNKSTVPDRVWQMCGGLPLAIVTMAGVVAASKPLMIREEWLTVCNSLFPEPEKCHKPEEFMRIINYCYNDLPSDLKICCLYLSIFPKGREVSRKLLIRQGLSVEDVAETCFKQLIERKIMRPLEHNSNGSVKSCRVHDMVLEYIISKAAEENFITVVGSHWSMSTGSNKVRRLSVHGSDPKRAKSVDSMNLSHVRSLNVFENLDKLHFKSFKTGIVQVLDLEGCKGFRESHAKVSDICEMILLKYLSLRKTDVKNLPQNISKLKYLETLDVRETEVKQLPATVGQMQRITNILGGDKKRRRTLKLPKELKGTMKSLRVMSGVEIVEGSTAASDFSYFTTLRKLAIYRIHNNDDIFKNLLSSIQYLSGYSLQTLLIVDESSEFFKTLDSMSSSHLTDLRALELSGKLLNLPKWLASLHNLVKLTLSATVLCSDNLFLIGKLSSLFSLTFSISEKQDPAMAAILEKNKYASRGEIFVPAGGFSKLKLLRIFVPLLPSLTIAKKATPQLERIELRFKKLEALHGVDELGMLHDVVLTVDGQASEKTKSILDGLNQGQKRPSKYTLIVNKYND